MWGNCLCSDGVLKPGCDPSNSDTWTDLSNSTATLPRNLSLTCVVLGPPPGTSGTSGSPDEQSNSSGRGGRGLGKGAIAGIVVGSVAGGVVMGAAAAYLGLLGARARAWTQARLVSSYEEVDRGEGLMPSHIGFSLARSSRPKRGGSVFGSVSATCLDMVHHAFTVHVSGMHAYCLAMSGVCCLAADGSVGAVHVGHPALLQHTRNSAWYDPRPLEGTIVHLSFMR